MGRTWIMDKLQVLPTAEERAVEVLPTVEESSLTREPELGKVILLKM